MTTISNISIKTLGIALATLVFAATPFVASAADLDLGGYDTGWVDTGYYDTYSPSYSTSYDTGWVDTGYYDTYSPSYDYADYGYGSASYGGGFGGGFPFSYGGGFGGFGGGGLTNTNTNVITNTNTCTSGSCNTAINAPTTINAPIVNNATPSQTVYQPVYTPVYTSGPIYSGCNTCGCAGYYCNTPIAYNQPAPYVSLSAVPYTGLDLGPWGTAAYWGFLVLWCLVAAYLIVVKRVQNKVVSGLNGFLFGERSTKVATVSTSTPVAKEVASNKVFAGIDPFIASQINRAAF